MAGNNRGGRGLAGKVALGGIFSALAIIILLAGGIIPVGTFAAPIFAGICLMPIAMDIGVRWALLCYVVVSVISALMVPDTELILFFIVLFGYYPILRPALQKIKFGALRWLAKLLILNCAIVVVYTLLILVFGIPAFEPEMLTRPEWVQTLIVVVLLLVGNATFILYDNLLSRLRPIYEQRIRRFFKR